MAKSSRWRGEEGHPASTPGASAGSLRGAVAGAHEDHEEGPALSGEVVAAVHRGTENRGCAVVVRDARLVQPPAAVRHVVPDDEAEAILPALIVGEEGAAMATVEGPPVEVGGMDGRVRGGWYETVSRGR